MMIPASLPALFLVVIVVSVEHRRRPLALHWRVRRPKLSEKPSENHLSFHYNRPIGWDWRDRLMGVRQTPYEPAAGYFDLSSLTYLGSFHGDETDQLEELPALSYRLPLEQI